MKMNANYFPISSKADRFDFSELGSAGRHIEQFVEGPLELNIKGHSDSVRVSHAYDQFAATQLHWWKWSPDTSAFIGSAPEDSYFVSIVINGSCTVNHRKQELEAVVGSVFMINPGDRAEYHFGQNNQRLTLVVSKSILERSFLDGYGYLPTKPIEFDLNTHTSGSGNHALLGLINTVCTDLSQRQQGFSSLRIQDRMQELLLLTLLESTPHNYSTKLAAKNFTAAPHYVCRAEEYIQANLNKTITIADLSKVTGVCGRSIVNGFKRFRGATPFALIKMERLKIAREKLLAAHPNKTNVTNVVLDVGFTHLGRFAAEYKRKFGESPSETLRQC